MSTQSKQPTPNFFALQIPSSSTPYYTNLSLLPSFPIHLYLFPFAYTMTACDSLSSLFENPLPSNPSLIESLSSWKHHKPVEVSSLAEIFGELYFHEKPSSESHIPSPPSLAPPTLDHCPKPNISWLEHKSVKTFDNPPSEFILDLPKNQYRSDTKCNRSFSTMNFESLQLCTEGLGSESSDDVDDMLESGDDRRSCGEGTLEVRRRPLMYGGGFNGYLRGYWDVKASKSGREFPPPISSIGRNGRPCLRLKSYREDGRFVLREIRIPSQEFLHASREDGRLKLHFVHPDDDIDEGEDNQELDECEEQEEHEEEKVSEE